MAARIVTVADKARAKIAREASGHFVSTSKAGHRLHHALAMALHNLARDRSDPTPPAPHALPMVA